MNLGPGQLVERYRIEKQLGEGGLSTVFLARHERLGSLHALKISRIVSAEIQARLLREGQVQARLRHPNLVPVTDVIEVQGHPCLVMEYVAGPTLADFVQDGLPSIPAACALARDILRGMAAAHREEVVHRDLKPGNVLLATVDGRLSARVVDFGLVKSLEDVGALNATRSGVAMGTPRYMAPEQTRDAKAVDLRADVYSLGAVLYELFCGRPPHIFEDVVELFSAIRAGDFPKPTTLRPQLPLELEDILLEAMEVDPADRFPSAVEMLVAWQAATDALAESPLAGDRWSTLSPALDPPLFKSAGDQRQTRVYPSLSAASAPPTSESPASKQPVSNPAIAPASVAGDTFGLLDQLGADAALTTPEEAPAPLSRGPMLPAALALVGLLAVGGWWTLRPDVAPQEVPPTVSEVAPVGGPVEVVAPKETEEAAPEQAPAATVGSAAPKPEARPEPVRSRPPSVQTPAAPAPAAPAPSTQTLVEDTPAEPVAPASRPAMARVELDAPGVSVWLVDGTQRLRAGAVHPGRYEVRAVFSEGAAEQGQGFIEVGPGEVASVRCVADLNRCVLPR